jgi:hypothetical protein
MYIQIKQEQSVLEMTFSAAATLSPLKASNLLDVRVMLSKHHHEIEKLGHVSTGKRPSVTALSGSRVSGALCFLLMV